MLYLVRDDSRSRTSNRTSPKCLARDDLITSRYRPYEAFHGTRRSPIRYYQHRGSPRPIPADREPGAAAAIGLGPLADRASDCDRYELPGNDDDRSCACGRVATFPSRSRAIGRRDAHARGKLGLPRPRAGRGPRQRRNLRRPPLRHRPRRSRRGPQCGDIRARHAAHVDRRRPCRRVELHRRDASLRFAGRERADAGVRSRARQSSNRCSSRIRRSSIG